MNNISVNLYGYCSNYVFLHNFPWLDVGEFKTKLVKMLYFFYYINYKYWCECSGKVYVQFFFEGGSCTIQNNQEENVILVNLVSVIFFH